MNKNINLFIIAILIFSWISFVSISVSSAESYQKIPDAWKGQRNVIETVNGNKHIVSIHYNKDKTSPDQINSKSVFAGTVTQSINYYQFIDMGDGQAYKVFGKWNVSDPINGNVTYYINPAGSGNDPTLTFQAVKRGIEKWNDNSFNKVLRSSQNPYSTTLSPILTYMDNYNVLGWGYYNDPDVLALTSTWVDNYNNILESDILFNTYYTWGINSENECNNNYSFVDIQNIATHESGHFYGLMDIYNIGGSSVNYGRMTMYGYSGYGEISKRSLEFGDIYGMKTLYEFNVQPVPTTTATPTPTPTPTPSQTPTPTPTPTPINLIKNPDFSMGTTYWRFYTNSIGKFEVLSGTAILTLSGTGSNVQFYQYDIPLEQNGRYRLTFDAYSNTGNDLEIHMIKNTPPYNNYGLNSFVNITNVWKTYSVEFITTGFTGNVTDGCFRFWISPYGRNGDLYSIDNVKLEKVS